MEQKYLLTIKTEDALLTIGEIDNFAIKSQSILPKRTNKMMIGFTPQGKQWNEGSYLEVSVEKYIGKEVVLYRGTRAIYRGLITGALYATDGNSVTITLFSEELPNPELTLKAPEFKPLILMSEDYKPWNISLN